MQLSLHIDIFSGDLQLISGMKLKNPGEVKSSSYLENINIGQRKQGEEQSMSVQSTGQDTQIPQVLLNML